ncbi:hypothetical protein BC936DRAFT_146574 [Jimgerdemannia flammicorona]|uniref:Uncharacterized protein n=1 Tax=Jimgerdemannia flammicorona TaxID=994334 RepID=A0A433D797_9FUNG|nr:hypothetical protein BC936DRAFT_146574 [Jimgerdemannia flammicorona]
MDQRKSQEALERIYMSEAPQPTAVSTALLSYQEHPPDPTEDAPVQFWTVNKDDQGEHYYNMVADIATKKRFHRPRYCQQPAPPINPIVIPLSSSCRCPSSGTEWNYSNLCRCVTQDQFSSHVPSARELKTYVFYESDRNESPAFLATQDVVLTTYTVLSYHDRDKNKGLFDPCHQEPQDEVGRGVHELRGRTAVGPDRHADPELRERPLLPRHVPTPRAVRQSQMVEQILCEAVEARRLHRSLALYCALTPDQYPTLHLRFNGPPSPGSRGHLAPQAPHALRLPALYQGHVLRRLPHPRLPGIESFLHRIVFTDEVPPLEDEVKSAESEEQGAVEQTEDTVDMKRLVETLQSAIEDNEDCYNCLETLTKTVITPCQHVFD